MTIGVGIVGTGYAAKKRAEAVASGLSLIPGQVRSHLVAIAGDADRAQVISKAHGAESTANWQQLVADDRIELVIVATVNVRHGDVVEAALRAGRHVVVEYPLALDVAQAHALVQLAVDQQRLLHIEHIELLGGLHQAAKAHLSLVGQPHTARYTTLAPQYPAPRKWSYRLDLSGFPLVAALSRVSRLVDLFGEVIDVTCRSQFDSGVAPYYRACLCEATLRFASGVVAELVYGKGARDWSRARRLEISGSHGQLLFEGDQGQFYPSPSAAKKASVFSAPGKGVERHDGSEETPSGQTISVKPRRGLFRQDTQQVVDHLIDGTDIWPPPSHSLYALTVADALRRSAETGRSIQIDASVGMTNTGL